MKKLVGMMLIMLVTVLLVSPVTSAETRIEEVIELNDPLIFEYPVTTHVCIIGKFINEDGDNYDKLELYYIDSNDNKENFIAKSDYKDNKYFGFLVDGRKFNKVGKIGIYYNELLLATGKVVDKTE